MKKVLFTLASVMLLSLAANAQYKQHAIGLRLGDSDGFGGELSYQRALGDNNRLELDLGLRDNRNIDAFKLTGIYQWVWNIEGGFNWFAGFGAGLGYIDYDNGYFDNFPGRDDDRVFITVEGQIGIEYIFREAPLQIGLDARPTVFLFNEYYNDYYNDFGLDLALSLRYQFN